MSDNDCPNFIIDTDPKVDWPVIVTLPTTGGTFGKFKFTASIRVLSPAEYEEIFKSKAVVDAPVIDADKPALIKMPLMSAVMQENAPVFQRLISGWDGINDQDGNAVIFTAEKLAEQIFGPRGPALSIGLWRAINEVRFGAHLGDENIPKASLGN